MKPSANKIVISECLLQNKTIDIEWLQLIIESKKLGIEKEDIRRFLKNPVIPFYK